MENVMTSLTAALSLLAVLVDGSSVSVKTSPAELQPLVTEHMHRRGSDVTDHLTRRASDVTDHLTRRASDVTDHLTRRGIPPNIREFQNLRALLRQQNMKIAKLTRQMAKQGKQMAKQGKQMAKQGKQIGFTAGLNKATTVSRDQTVKYDQVSINIGNGYSPKTGEFTAPASGTYKVDVNARNQGKNSFAVLSLVHNGKNVFTVFADDGEYNSASNSAVVHLNRGDVLKVVSSTHSKMYGHSALVYNTFSGFLLALD